ncbi:MAG: hypothetical protein E7376_05150 [Clostridiales bacterium]|nr:hypothetical protein [Clostridiales bacterium]
MGEYNSTPLKWYAFGYSASGSEEISTGNMTTLDGTVFTDTTSANVPAGTYYFISEYAIGTTAFNTTKSDVFDDMQYNGSTLQTAINTLATSSTYKINESDIYSQISARTLAGEKPNSMFEEDSNSIIDRQKTNSTTNQTLWALNYDEVSVLLGNNASTSTDMGKHKTTNITVSTTTACGWWLRTPSEGNADFNGSLMTCVSANGNFGFSMVDYTGNAIRPAFKLVIA